MLGFYLSLSFQQNWFHVNRGPDTKVITVFINMFYPVCGPVNRPCNRVVQSGARPTGFWTGCARRRPGPGPVPSGSYPGYFSLASGCRPVRSPVWTGCSGHRSGLTGPSAGRPVPDPVNRVSRGKTLRWQVPTTIFRVTLYKPLLLPLDS